MTFMTTMMTFLKNLTKDKNVAVFSKVDSSIFSKNYLKARFFVLN